ncbi:MAG: histidinol-phosphate transaminase [Rhodospirillales bacterium]|nr:histidinol-phosphate transaminase [Rhodospirillales bacterium]
MDKSSILNRARPEIAALKAYQSARTLFQGGDGNTIFLDANELPCAPFIGAKDYNRYPDQQPVPLMEALARLYDVSTRNILATRGADEAIDLLVRAFCVPGQDNIVICPPTFAMYAQAVRVQGCESRAVALTDDFQLDVKGVGQAIDDDTKIIFGCSPNNPTGNLMKRDDIEALCKALDGKALVVVDETYMEFAGEEHSMIQALEAFPNLVILRTLSKAYAAAGVRCGCAIASTDIIDLVRKILGVYPIPQPVVEAVTTLLSDKNKTRMAAKRRETLETRDRFISELQDVPGIIRVFPTDANFVMIACTDAPALTARCRKAGIIIRDQSYQPGLENCVRVGIGTREEMSALLTVLKGGERALKSGKRIAVITRKTKETAIAVRVNLDEPGPVSISTGIGFYDHMLEQIARHGGFSLQLECDGDLEIDPHHTVEDCAITLGQALKEALGDKAGIGRYGFTLPMDEALASAALDLSGRYYLTFEGRFPESRVGDLPTDMVAHVFRSLAENMQASLHMSVTGENTHHMVEGCFKAFGRALRQAIRKEGEELPSTKGIL